MNFAINYSIRSRHNDLQWIGAGYFLRNPVGLTVLSSFTRNQSNPPNGVHVQPNVFRVHERKGQ